MTRMTVAGLLLVLAGAGITGCSSSGSSGSSSASDKPLCDSIASLKQSAGKLQDLHSSENGIAALRDQIPVVKSDLDHVIADAKVSYASASDKLATDLANVRTAAAAVKENPSRDALAAVKSPLTTLVEDTRSLADQVASGCS